MASTMSRQDFELIARTISRLSLSREEREHVAEAFAHILAATNPRFDHDRFIAACAKAKT